MKIGEKIKVLMSESNIDIAALAKDLGKSRQAVYDLLDKKDVNTSVLRDLCKIFNVPITIFFEENISHLSNVSGDSNIVVGHNNNGEINANCKQKLDNALSEIKFLKAELDNKNKLLEEKERLINVLLKK
jgi:hypothetical protein